MRLPEFWKGALTAEGWSTKQRRRGCPAPVCVYEREPAGESSNAYLSRSFSVFPAPGSSQWHLMHNSRGLNCFTKEVDNYRKRNFSQGKLEKEQCWLYQSRTWSLWRSFWHAILDFAAGGALTGSAGLLETKKARAVSAVGRQIACKVLLCKNLRRWPPSTARISSMKRYWPNRSASMKQVSQLKRC